MRIQNNIAAYNTHRQYNIANNAVASSTEKLSSGYRINRAGDDAAGLAISEKMRGQIRGLEMASKNSSDAISMVQTAEGALQETHNILQRMRELAVQSSTDTNDSQIDRTALQAEFSHLKDEIDEIATTTRFNDQDLIDGSFAAISKKLGVGTELKHPGMNIQLGNAKEGTYELTISKKVISPEIAAKAPEGTVVLDSVDSSIFKDGGGMTVTGGGGTWDETALFNGNYKINVVSAENNIIKFQAVNDQGQTFEATLDVTASDLTAGKTLELDFGGFKLGLELDAGLQATANDPLSNSALKTLGDALGNVEFSINGGADKQEKVEAYFASMTGGESVLLEAGMDSLSFTNGVTVNFDKLSAADVDAGSATGPAQLGGDQISKIIVQNQKNAGMVIQTGANEGDQLSINIDRMDTSWLNIVGAKVDSQKGASSAISSVNDALNQVSSQRANLGALQNRLNHKINNLNTSAENLTAAESRIRDVDMAKEMTAFSKKNILVQASTSMLAQANQASQNVLQLLR